VITTALSTGSEVGREPSDGSSFAVRVAEVVAGTTVGEVVTYGEVAAEAGHPDAARAVGRALRDHGGGLPWWRVVTATGRLAPGKEARQADRLEAEGVSLDRERGKVSLDRERAPSDPGGCGAGRAFRPGAGGARLGSGPEPEERG
jgi:methylated-DNA-protein-cysteine methyltransferase-like protein